ncbi:hypothetical protein M3210_14530 [Oceanobacillus luteolus]|uniref:Uncharacterized protein n=1 Tax=Oceanobacillus luteolus TaxID=1274358 RepID=A0ABW4HKL2_9BACI|nr:hypothetical protein [Oceanobacillus luteolus]MCM3741487.1 hypothetical protein [Oceanobacillus luteolus]
MNKSSKTGKTLALIGGGIILFGTVLMINDDGGTLTSLAIPFIFIGLLVIMASILFIGNLSNKAFHINNFIFLFMLLAFNAIALFGALFSNTAGSETYFATGLSYVIWGVFYFLQFVRPNKIWRITWFLMMVVFLFFWQTGLGYLIGQMIF